MSGDGVDDIQIPAVLISRDDGILLRYLSSENKNVRILLHSGSEEELKKLHEAVTNKQTTESSNQSDNLNHPLP